MKLCSGTLEDLLPFEADCVTSTVDNSPDGLHFTSNLYNSLDQGSPSVHDLSQTSSWLASPHISSDLAL